jgi:hypothetical protein
LPTRRYAAEVLLAAVEAVNAHGSIKAAADALGMARTTLSDHYHAAVKEGVDPKIVASAPSGHAIKGVSTLYDAGGNVIQQWIKTRTDQPPLEEIIEAVRGAFDEYRGAAKDVHTEHTLADEELATVYPLADWHIGLLAWGREVGQDWDLPKAESDIRGAMERLVAASPASSTAVVLGLGDLLHSDGYANATARSNNKLDVDGRYPKVLVTATKLILYTIDLALQKHEHVIVRLIPGNHDDQSAIAVSLALAVRFDGHPRVKVDDDPGRFWWWRWGKVFLGAAHGDMAKMRELPLIMASSHPEEWGATTHKMVFTGHIHHREKLNAKEFGGVDVESFNSPAGKDAWQVGMGFVSKRSVHSLTFHNVDGEVMRNRAVILSR